MSGHEISLRTDEQVYYDTLRLLDASAYGEDHPLIESHSVPGMGQGMGLRSIPRLFNSLRALATVEVGEKELTEKDLVILRLSYLDTLRLVESSVRSGHGHSKALSLENLKAIFQELHTLRQKHELTGPAI